MLSSEMGLGSRSPPLASITPLVNGSSPIGSKLNSGKVWILGRNLGPMLGLPINTATSGGFRTMRGLAFLCILGSQLGAVGKNMVFLLAIPAGSIT
mgnify:CR=1 FL=1